MRRSCDRCGVEYEARTSRSKFCGSTCRARKSDGTPVKALPARRPSTKVADALRVELEELGVAALYEGAVALGIAEQLDGGSVAGAAYASLSKELDRRVEGLRRRAVKGHDPAAAVRSSLNAKRLRVV